VSDVYPRFKVAAIQAAPVFFDRDKTVDKAVLAIEEAADKGAVIIGFPEAFIPGHPELWFSAKKSNPLKTMGGLFKELVKNGVKVPSPATERLCKAAEKAHAFVVAGIGELDANFSGTLYISQLFISDEGEIMGVHRKLVPTVSEKLIYSSGDGSYFQVFETSYGKISGMVCGEHTNDLYKYALLSMGTEIHVAGWPSFPEGLFGKRQRDSIDFRVRQFANEGKIFVINCCSVTDSQNVEACCDTPEEKEPIVLNSGGGSAIIGPGGEYLAGPTYEGEAVLTAEISLEDCLPGKQLHNVLGHYTRWDIFSLNFNRRRLAPFAEGTWGSGPSEYSAGLREIREELIKINQRVDDLAEEVKKAR
jgi:aliphatic nitrilase